MSTNGSGYIKLHRKIIDSWQFKNSQYLVIWVWMLLQAKYQDDPSIGLKRGQFFSTVRDIANATGTSKTTVHRFLAYANECRDIVWEKGFRGTESGTNPGTKSGTVLSRFSITKYDCYQTESGTKSGTKSGTVSPSSSKRKKKKELKNSPDAVAPVSSENSQVYDFYITTRRDRCRIPVWEPTANQAMQMRSNIKTLLDNGNSAGDLVSWLTNYFSDQRHEKDKWPWTFFMSDPVRWSGPTDTDTIDYMEDF